MAKLNLILGAAAIGNGKQFSTASELQTLLGFSKTQKIKNIDTAATYPSTAPGTSEKLLGEVKTAGQGFDIDTKILVGGAGCLSSAAIRASTEDSLKTLGIEKVNVLYCHNPDYKTPLEEIVRTFDELYKAGKFQKWGVSNFSATMLADILQNPVCRKAEAQLLPLLKANGIVFNAFSPLAGGFFTGNATRGGEAIQGTRYAEPNNPQVSMYSKPCMHTAFNGLSEVLEPLGISGTEAALRWFEHHSALSDGDGIILGFSKISQIEKNVEDIKKGPLPESVVKVFEAVWADIEAEAPEYYATEEMSLHVPNFVRVK